MVEKRATETDWRRQTKLLRDGGFDGDIKIGRLMNNAPPTPLHDLEADVN